MINSNSDNLERSYSIDFYKGIAAIAIVAIHTAWWSGEAYVPKWFASLTLFLDVPFFIFLSGWGCSLSKKISLAKTGIRLFQTWITYVIYASVLNILDFIITNNTITAQEWARQILFLQRHNIVLVPLFSGSIWFFPMWLVVSGIGSLIIYVMIRIDKEDFQDNLTFVLLVLLVGIFMFSSGREEAWFLLNRETNFYLLIFLVGYKLASKEIKSIKGLVAIVAAEVLSFGGLMKVYDITEFNVQVLKFPPHVLYLMASMIGISFAVFFKTRSEEIFYRCKLIRFVGKNAIYFYFSQAIGGSILIKVAPMVLRYVNAWMPTFFICFFINLCISLVSGIGITYIFSLLWKLISPVTSKLILFI